MLYSLKELLLTIIDVGHSIVELSQLAAVPSVCCTDEIAGDAL